MWLKKAKKKKRKGYFANNHKVYQCCIVWRALQNIALPATGCLKPKGGWLLLKLPLNENIHYKSRILVNFFLAFFWQQYIGYIVGVNV